MEIWAEKGRNIRNKYGCNPKTNTMNVPVLECGISRASISVMRSISYTGTGNNAKLKIKGVRK